MTTYADGPARRPAIKAVPVTHRGITFRSTLEADWARMFDYLDWYWQYEPIAVLVDGEPYLCDFHLSVQRVWCEVKGPHNERINKVAALHRTLQTDPWNVMDPLVVILRPAGPGDVAVWESVGGDNVVLVLCPECQHYGFMDYHGIWRCRRGCRNPGNNKFWSLPGGGLWISGEIRFERAPRQVKRT